MPILEMDNMHATGLFHVHDGAAPPGLDLFDDQVEFGRHLARSPAGRHTPILGEHILSVTVLGHVGESSPAGP